MTDNSGVRAVIYVLKTDPDFAVTAKKRSILARGMSTPLRAWWSPKMPRLPMIPTKSMTTCWWKSMTTC